MPPTALPAGRELRRLRDVLAEHEPRLQRVPQARACAAPPRRRGRTARARDWRSRTASRVRASSSRAQAIEAFASGRAASPAVRTARGVRRRRAARRPASDPRRRAAATKASSADRNSSNGAPSRIWRASVPDEPKTSSTSLARVARECVGNFGEREVQVRRGRDDRTPLCPGHRRCAVDHAAGQDAGRPSTESRHAAILFSWRRIMSETTLRGHAHCTACGWLPRR